MKTISFSCLILFITILLLSSTVFAQDDEGSDIPIEEQSSTLSGPMEITATDNTAATHTIAVSYYKDDEKSLVMGTVTAIDKSANTVSVETRTGQIKTISIADATILLRGERIQADDITDSQRIGVMGVEREDVIYPTRPVIVHPNKSSFHHVTGVVKKRDDGTLSLQDSENGIDIEISDSTDISEGEVAISVVEEIDDSTTRTIRTVKRFDKVIEKIGTTLSSDEAESQGIQPEHEVMHIIEKLGSLNDDISGEEGERIRERLRTTIQNHIPIEAWEEMPTEAGQDLRASAWGYVPDEAFQHIKDRNFEHIPPEAYDHIKDTAYQHIRPEAFGHIKDEALHHIEMDVVEQTNPDAFSHISTGSIRQFQRGLSDQQDKQSLGSSRSDKADEKRQYDHRNIQPSDTIEQHVIESTHSNTENSLTGS